MEMIHSLFMLLRRQRIRASVCLPARVRDQEPAEHPTLSVPPSTEKAL